MAKLFRAHSGFPLEHVATFRFVPGVAWTDHRSFRCHGHRALMVTDTAFYRNPHHRAEDTPDKLGYPQLAYVTEGRFRSLAVLARQGFDRMRKPTSHGALLFVIPLPPWTFGAGPGARCWAA
jgi:hypothetical protein